MRPCDRIRHPRRIACPAPAGRPTVRVHALHWPVLHDAFARVALRSPRPSAGGERASEASAGERTSERPSQALSERYSRTSGRLSERSSAALSEGDPDDEDSVGDSMLNRARSRSKPGRPAALKENRHLRSEAAAGGAH